MRYNKLDEEGLQRLGFKDSGEKDILDRIKWRMEVPYYYWQIQMVLGPYPSNNPNCGILSLYNPADEAVSFSKKGKKKIIKFDSREIPIAWYVDSYERLRTLILSLSQSNI